MVNTQTPLLQAHMHSIHALFEAHAAATPHAPALVAGTQTLSYGQLNRYANRVAHCILGCEFPRETLIGIHAGRSVAQIACILGILKAGCAYTLLDRKTPHERMRAVVQDAALKLVLVDAADCAHLSDLTQLMQVERLADDAPGPYGSDNPALASALSDLAYVIFTSGSTGVPKGVMIEHRGIIPLVREANFMRLDASTRTMQLAAMSFDLAVFEVFCALLSGGCLVLYDRDSIDIAHLNALIVDQGINTFVISSGIFDLWSHHLPANSALSQILIAGDVLNPLAVERVYQAMPQVTVINGYGPTESTVFTACHVVPPAFDPDSAIPIGHVVKGTQVCIVSAEGALVDAGEVGELWVAGEGLARGYLNRPELTAEKFILSHIQGKPIRYYRSGDLVRTIANGALEFVGRIDNQVKIRGFRVELDEIEVHLLNSRLVDSAVVLSQEVSGVVQLVAYVVVSANGASHATIEQQLRAYLAAKLPDFMLPSHVHFLSEFPLTAHGKVDRSALRQIKASQPAPAAAKLSLTQRLVREIWSAVLEVEADRLSTTENFFAVGGDSLLGIKMTALLNTQTGLKLPLPITTRFHTIAAIAAHIDDIRARALALA